MLYRFWFYKTAIAAHNGIGPETVLYPVHCLIERHHFLSILEKVNLIGTADKLAKAHANQAEAHAALVEFLKGFQYGACQCMVGSSISESNRACFGIKI